jgi:hypothetical protein
MKKDHLNQDGKVKKKLTLKKQPIARLNNLTSIKLVAGIVLNI